MFSVLVKSQQIKGCAEEINQDEREYKPATAKKQAAQFAKSEQMISSAGPVLDRINQVIFSEN